MGIQCETDDIINNVPTALVIIMSYDHVAPTEDGAFPEMTSKRLVAPVSV